MPPGHALRPHQRRLLRDLAEQTALAFRNARLTAELSGDVDRLARRTQDLAESRRRLISAGDAERSRLERAISRQVTPHLAPLPDRLHTLTVTAHDGAAAGRPDAQTIVLAGLVVSLNTALEALREITRGVYPAQLQRSGLPVALASLVGRAGGEGRLVVDPSAVGRRFHPRVEAAAYFCAAEATRDLDEPVVLRLSVQGEHLELVATGRDRGGMSRDDIRDRVESAGGSVAITEAGGLAVVEVQLPDHTASSRSGPNAALVT